ncbi:MAG: FKBP-type peptidyl-prolyl cis-trans isomerase [Acinetobacter sp.]|nr:FKBP-type peptidyl-prolyl cis-trans isomerase [Acinetobacter sp.]
MSKALPIAIATILGAAALAPVVYSMNNPASLDAISNTKLDQNATHLQKISYALGYSIAQQVPAEADSGAVMAGFNDARAQKESRYSQEEIQTAFQAYSKEVEAQHGATADTAAQAQATEAAPTSAVAAVSAEEAKKFFAENAKKEGVKTTASGLQYKIVKEGTGKQPTATSKVTVHYEGKLLNGQVFDSSIQRGEPVTFPLNQVIKGWTEGLSLVKEGSTVELYIPAELAYGSQERPGIPANSPLVFQVQLLKVE